MKRILSVLVLMSFFFGSVWAEPAVYFAEANLQAPAEAQLWVSDPAPAEMLELTSSRATDRGIAATSPCIDAGDPTSAVGQEPSPNGDVVNMGAYGGTAAGSRSSFDP